VTEATGSVFLSYVSQDSDAATHICNALRQPITTKHRVGHGSELADQASTLREVGALSDLDDISVRIADVAANLAVLGDRLCDELRTATFP
jgi:hypothetical protein